jgi:hypothetical protein
MKIIGTVVALDMNATIKKKAGGTYTGVRLTYRDKDGDLKEETIHENGIRLNQELGNGLNSLSVDSEFTMVKEKEGDFWNTKNITLGHDTSPSSSKSTSSSGGNWPTAEERAKIQVYIIRQSSLGHAVNFLSSFDKEATGNTVMAIAAMFEKFVHEGLPTDIANMEDDIPH